MELLLFRGITAELPWNYSLSTKNYHEMNERGVFYSKNSIYDLDFALEAYSYRRVLSMFSLFILKFGGDAIQLLQMLQTLTVIGCFLCLSLFQNL
jgi:hypothetical protein